MPTVGCYRGKARCCEAWKYRGVRNRTPWSTWPSVKVRTPNTKFSKEIPTQWWINQNGILFEKTFHFLEALRNQRVENSTFVKHSKIPAVQAAPGPVLHPYSRSSLVRWDRCSIDIAEMASVHIRLATACAWFPTTRTKKKTFASKKWYQTTNSISPRHSASTGFNSIKVKGVLGISSVYLGCNM